MQIKAVHNFIIKARKTGYTTGVTKVMMTQEKLKKANILAEKIKLYEQILKHSSDIEFRINQAWLSDHCPNAIKELKDDFRISVEQKLKVFKTDFKNI